jgi:hypothetical protein
LPKHLVPEVREVTGSAARGDLVDERRELKGRKPRVALLAARADDLVEARVRLGEAGERRLCVQDLERLGVVDEEADRQGRIELLDEQKIGDARLTLSGRAAASVSATRMVAR